MELPLQPRVKRIRFNSLIVSILVLMELPLQPVVLYWIEIIMLVVSILVLMELPLQREQNKRRRTEQNVSILVLMELPLQHYKLPCQPGDILWGFNPCFNGTTSATPRYIACNIRLYKCFNPCFNGTTSATG